MLRSEIPILKIIQSFYKIDKNRFIEDKQPKSACFVF